MNITTKPQDQIGYEAHRKMLDVHMNLEGCEAVGMLEYIDHIDEALKR